VTIPIRTAIVGAGYVSAYHLRALQTLDYVKVVGIVDPDQAKAQTLATQFGIPAVFRNLDEMASSTPDVVHILTPPALHRELSIRAMTLGSHVLVEKPMAETVEDCDLMLAAAKATGRVLSVNHSARMDPVVLRALDLVRSGSVGDILAVHFFRSSDYAPYAGGPMPAPFRRGGYPFEDLGVHGFCLIEAFLGPIRDSDVRYRSTGRDPHLFFDEWHATVEAEKGTGHMYISWNSRPMQNELVIHGTRGIISVDCYLQTLSVHRTMPAPKPLQRMIGTALVAAGNLYHVPLNAIKFVTGRLKPNSGIHVSVCKFYEALANGQAPPVPAAEGRRIVFWIQQSTREADAAKSRALAPSPSIEPPRVLVTGASGLLGGALLRRLRERGDVVRVLLRRPAAELTADPRVDVVYGDLGDPAAVDQAIRGVDLVYHVGAAMGGPKAAFDAGTIGGTKNVVESCLRHNVKRLVYVSSIVLLDHAGHTPGTTIDETYALEPHAGLRGFYTQAKLVAEQTVVDAIRDRGLPAVIVRPGQIFGPGSEKFAPAGTIAFAGRWIVVGNGRRHLPFAHIEDIVDALLLAAERDHVVGSTFHIVDTVHALTQNDYIEASRSIVGAKLRVRHVPGPVLMAAAIAAGVVSRVTKIPLPLSPYRLRSSRPLGPFDCRAARDVLGWTPRHGPRDGVTYARSPQAVGVLMSDGKEAFAAAKDI
jgi:predicted dehydrogenase/nucleoside-diphosphate-sugar epimerase